MTQALTTGHWPSYNQPYFLAGRSLSGNDAMYAKLGDAYSYALNPRAKIVSQDEEFVVVLVN